MTTVESIAAAAVAAARNWEPATSAAVIIHFCMRLKVAKDSSSLNATRFYFINFFAKQKIK